MKDNIIILSAKAWDMPDEKTGEMKSGCTIYYVPSLEKVCNEEGKFYGYVPVKETLPKEFINSVKSVGGCPCNAEGTFVIRFESGKQLLKLSDCVIK